MLTPLAGYLQRDEAWVLVLLGDGLQFRFVDRDVDAGGGVLAHLLDGGLKNLVAGAGFLHIAQ